ncbi:hypothetical protein B0H17DRAFT_1178209 [Mycena rosella]|uniref:Uncharacterized protein n=1 Tax=Mycena rosella TaxID=1033263 RepID=A0AAD7GN79_MYCRO|nr:hypothetical protein B0H17DRAFT_1178209 [Mycena rosella]
MRLADAHAERSNLLQTENDKSILVPEYVVGDSAILHTVMDETSDFLQGMYSGAILDRLLQLDRSDPEADELKRFRKILHSSPLPSTEFRTSKETVVVPPHVAALWDEVLAENPWIPNYVARAGQVRRDRCSKILYVVEGTWTASDVCRALAKSDFASDVQEALMEMAPDFPFVLNFSRPVAAFEHS